MVPVELYWIEAHSSPFSPASVICWRHVCILYWQLSNPFCIPNFIKNQREAEIIFTERRRGTRVRYALSRRRSSHGKRAWTMDFGITCPSLLQFLIRYLENCCCQILVDDFICFLIPSFKQRVIFRVLMLTSYIIRLQFKQYILITSEFIIFHQLHILLDR